MAKKRKLPLPGCELKSLQYPKLDVSITLSCTPHTTENEILWRRVASVRAAGSIKPLPLPVTLSVPFLHLKISCNKCLSQKLWADSANILKQGWHKIATIPGFWGWKYRSRNQMIHSMYFFLRILKHFCLKLYLLSSSLLQIWLQTKPHTYAEVSLVPKNVKNGSH